MVLSKLNNEISYHEHAHLDLDDASYESPVFEIPILGVNVYICIGKLKYNFSKIPTGIKVVYVFIYLMNQSNEVYKRIGVFEMPVGKVPIDDDNDLELGKVGKPLLYSYVTKQMLQKSLSSSSSNEQPQQKEKQKEEEKQRQEEKQGEGENQGQEEKENQGQDTQQEEEQNTQEEQEEEDEDGPHANKNEQPIVLQTREQSELERQQYKPGPNDIWIQKYLRNKYFGIMDNEGASDGLFAAIRDAMMTVGKTTNIIELRGKLADKMTEQVYSQYREKYISHQNTLKTQQLELKAMTDRHNDLKERIKHIHDKAQQQLMIAEGKKLMTEFAEKKKEAMYTKVIASEIDFMKDIKSHEQLKKKIQTSLYWPDKWALDTLERSMNVKFIRFSSGAYNNRDTDNVLWCESAQEQPKPFEPTSYIMLETSCIPSEAIKCGYKLITYKTRGVFSFSEIPYDIKLLIVSKCLEGKGGAFSVIPQFQMFQKELGIEGHDIALDIEELPLSNGNGTNEQKYTPDIVFQFYHKSDNGPLPGLGSGEKIPESEKAYFRTLAETKDWRRMLSNFWQTPFTLDGHTWQSVEHYYQGSKFKNNNREFYLKFSLDSRSDIASDPAVAKAAGSKTGKLKDTLLRPKNISIDPDFFGGRNEREMENAMMAKFSQNNDLKRVLLATRNAKLVHYVRGSPPVVFTNLMEVRYKIRNNAKM